MARSLFHSRRRSPLHSPRSLPRTEDEVPDFAVVVWLVPSCENLQLSPKRHQPFCWKKWHGRLAVFLLLVARIVIFDKQYYSCFVGKRLGEPREKTRYLVD